jgi:hypothetical protein
MNPYLTIPIALPGDEDKGNPDKVVDCQILPAQVLAYHEGYGWGTCIYLSTGQAFMSTLTPKEYEAYVRKYWDEVSRNIKTSNSLKLMQ